MTYDAVVIGLGGAGSSALWALARRGVKALGIEQFDIGHAQGSSHGRSRLYRGGAAEGAEYVALAKRSLDVWRDLEQRTGTEIVTLTGGVTIGASGSALVENTVAVLSRAGMEHERLNADALRTRFPQHRITDADVGVFDPATGVARPELAIHTAIDAARKLGAETRQGTVVAIEDIEGGHRITLAGGESIVTPRVIVSAGAWVGKLIPELAPQFTVRRAVLSWFHAKPGYEEQFTAGQFPVFTREDEYEIGWGAGSIDEYQVKIGIHDQAGYEIEDPAANTQTVEPWELERVQAFCERQFEGLIPVAQHPHGCMITMTPDEKFSIGEVRPGLTLLAACSGHGFKHAAGVGDLGAAIALAEDPEFDISVFAPFRFIH